MADPATIHLVIGATGAGKTTYARSFADELGAIRFSIDEWMQALFWMDAPPAPDIAWALARVERARDLIWRTAADAARRGCPAILEIGLTTRADRAAMGERARAAGLSTRLHWLDVPVEERWRRVQARNSATGPAAQLAFAITRAMFDEVETMWEAPTGAELDGAVVSSTGASQGARRQSEI